MHKVVLVIVSSVLTLLSRPATHREFEERIVQTVSADAAREMFSAATAIMIWRRPEQPPYLGV